MCLAGLNIRQFMGGEGIDFDNYPDENGDISYATEAQRIANLARISWNSRKN